MRAYCSRLAESGHVVFVRLPEGSLFQAQFADDGSVRELTPFVANLMLAGALDASEAQVSGRPEPEESVEAALVTYLEAAAVPGSVREQASFTWMHLPSGEGGDFPPADVIGLIVRGLTVELTAAVAAEAAAVPGDASELTDDGQGNEGQGAGA